MLKKTPLHATHLKLGAKMVEFAGFEMPIEYSGVMREHFAVRNTCGLFDVSHMGELELKGPWAFHAIQWLTSNNIGRLKDGQCQYTLICNETGGVIDDVIVYRISDEHFLIVTNASNTDKVFEWISEHTKKGEAVTNVSDDTAQIAIQGPSSINALKTVCKFDSSTLKSFFMASAKVCGIKVVISRTGYTGEDGFEIYTSNQYATEVFEGILEGAKVLGVMPVGLAARDTLRLEMGYPLYGSELTLDTTPIEAGLNRFVHLKHEGFLGRETLVRQEREGTDKRLIGFEMTDRGIARPECKIINTDGEELGKVTSGTHSPSLKRAIGMGYITGNKTKPGTEILIDIRGKQKKATITTRPFYKPALANRA